MSKKSEGFKFGTVTVPDGEQGDWAVKTFTIDEQEARRFNISAAYSSGGGAYLHISPGTYKKLEHKNRGVIMSNTPMEIRTCHDVWAHGTGRVFINGLGLGMVVEALLSKPDVTFIKVLELDPDVIKLVSPHFKAAIDAGRLEIVQGDAYAYKPAKDERYDYVWHDIWDDISSDNLKLMQKLTAKWRNRAGKQGVWSREQARVQARRERRESRQYMIPSWLFA